MNNLRGADCFINDPVINDPVKTLETLETLDEDKSYNFWYIFTLILISYIIYIFKDKKNIKII